MKYKYKGSRPERDKLHGLSPSEFKTLLRRRGYKVNRDFFKYGCCAQFKNRMYRFRHWSDQFFVDVSCPLPDFDRWANSTDDVLTIYNWMEKSDHGKV